MLLAPKPELAVNPTVPAPMLFTARPRTSAASVLPPLQSLEQSTLPPVPSRSSPSSQAASVRTHDFAASTPTGCCIACAGQAPPAELPLSRSSIRPLLGSRATLRPRHGF
ncbi:uncharacterized protein TrAtP1_011861 [Trichoderma atroviride]|uniref:uncharacterized protein n=1 Tax=Hypocrea atroviridis TaxID=63577 RepID=UPI00332FD08E|nr:hypothetical protein TrAtP1_011861 [Trichoderma atroviride]